MLILGITTSDPECGAALCRDGRTIEEREFQGSRACVEELVPLIEDMLKTNGLSYADIGLFAVDNGPGGLTGIKIGLAAIRTLAQFLDRPVAGISPLHAIAAAAPGEEETIFVATNCSASEVFTAVFSRGPNASVTRIADDRLDTPATGAARLLEHAGHGILLTGAAASRIMQEVEKSRSGESITIAPIECARPRASFVCMLAASADAVHWSQLQANYVCLTNAERQSAVTGSKPV